MVCSRSAERGPAPMRDTHSFRHYQGEKILSFETTGFFRIVEYQDGKGSL